MKLLIAIIISLGVGTYTTSIYTHHFTPLSGGAEISLQQYAGKKMLLVNMASESEYAAVQIPQLQQLQQQYGDSLVVIGFFSNDFNHEPRTDSVLKMLMSDTYHATFPVSVRIGVKDSVATTHPLFQWLQRVDENGSMNTKVSRDFQKYLIDKDGNIIGVFSGKINPMDTQIISAITE